ncbi:MAG: DUF971 domain-containing protein [Balneolaceae bacterium]
MANKKTGEGYSVRPVSVEVDNGGQTLEIEWSDGHLSEYPLFGLRKNCPCVMCRGGHSKMGQFDMKLFFVKPTRRYEIKNIKQVGNHALKITWDDGHDSGMYRWDLLRAMCPNLYETNRDETESGSS